MPLLLWRCLAACHACACSQRVSIKLPGNAAEAHLRAEGAEHACMCFRLLAGRAGGVDLSTLSIVSGKTCWVLYVDALLLNIGGNLHDALSVAAKVRVRGCCCCSLHALLRGERASPERRSLQGGDACARIALFPPCRRH